MPGSPQAALETVVKGCKMSDGGTCAVIVTHHPTEELLENLAAIRSQVEHLVVVDNRSAPPALELLDKAKSLFKCDVILNDDNLGNARALNLGISYAEKRGCEWVAFFDQDSSAHECYLAAMRKAYQEASSLCRVAMVAPRYVDRESGSELPSCKTSHGYLSTAMTSGCLIPLHVFDAIGRLDERLYVDYVDIELSLRCRHAGYSIVQARDALLRHSLGRLTTHSLCGRKFATTNHNASRRYYITRNRLLVLRRYWRDWTWSGRELQAFVTESLKIALVEEDKMSKFRSIAYGVIDAMKNRENKRFEL
jgi:rhamnosyltransferase